MAALRGLTALAPGRVRAAVGAGFTGRFTLGLRPVRLAQLEREVDDLRALLAGEERPHVEGGRPVRDMPVPGAEGTGAVPVYVSCRGERAQALARRRGDGAMTGILYPGGLGSLRAAIGPDLPLVVHAVGAVADEGEPLDSPRLRAAAGPVVAVAFHAFAEQPWRLEGLEPAVREQAAHYVAAVSAALSARAAPPGPAPGPPGRADPAPGRGRRDGRERGPLLADGHGRRAARAGGGPRRGRRHQLAVQPGGDVPAEMRRLAGRCSANVRTVDRGALATLLADWGEPAYRARQAAEAQRAGAGGWDEVTALPRGLRERLAGALPFWALIPDAARSRATAR